MYHLKWLYPGMKVKRWILLCALGMIMVIAGSMEIISPSHVILRLLGVLVLVVGIIVVIIGIRKMVKSFVSVFLPMREKEMVNIMYQKRQLERGYKIVVIGGGTGLSVLLHGIKEYTSNITAVVTVTDDGGSSGKLRDQFDILPPGDIRNCLVALADSESLMQELFQFRFKEDSEFQGHNFGNLFITAMSKLTGDFDKAIKESSKVLAIRGQVLPSTLERVRLIAEHQNGHKTFGESKISRSMSPVKKLYLTPKECVPSPEVLKSISEADAIILGPGSLYTSIIPNLLVKGIPEAIAKSGALKIYICNVMTQAGETDDYTASGHVKAIIEHSNKEIIDYCIVNVARAPEGLLVRYKGENAYPVLTDTEKIKELGMTVIETEVISVENYLRHDSEKLVRVIIDLIVDFKSGT